LRRIRPGQWVAPQVRTLECARRTRPGGDDVAGARGLAATAAVAPDVRRSGASGRPYPAFGVLAGLTDPGVAFDGRRCERNQGFAANDRRGDAAPWHGVPPVESGRGRAGLAAPRRGVPRAHGSLAGTRATIRRQESCLLVPSGSRAADAAG